MRIRELLFWLAMFEALIALTALMNGAVPW